MGDAQIANCLVSGEIVFAARPQLPPQAALRVQLLDTSYADAPATVLAAEVFTDIAADANQGKPLPFSLYGPAPNPRISCTVSAHVALQGSDRVQPGDYRNTQSYPVITYGYPDRVSIRVERIG